MIDGVFGPFVLIIGHQSGVITYYTGKYTFLAPDRSSLAIMFLDPSISLDELSNRDDGNRDI
jgi:hypothetical protein